MPRRIAGFFIALSLFGAPAPNNALWPDKLGDLSRTSAQKVVVENRDLWDEYGLEVAEKAEYAGKGKTLSLTAYRLKDPTGALAIYQWLRPAGAKPSKATDVAVETPDTLMALLGNYVVQAKGSKPTEFQLKQLYFNLPRVDQSSLPVLREYVPAKGLIPNSERYVSGPVSLQKFEPRISPSLAAFSMGAEAQLARYRTSSGEMSLAVFAYPTPQIARAKLDDFLKVPGTVAKRTGHMVAVVLNPPTPDDAERLLAQIKYEPVVTINETSAKKKPEPNLGDLIMGIVILAGCLIGLSVVFGLMFGGFRIILDRFGIANADRSFTALHLEDK